MEGSNRADAQRCDYLFQQFPMRYGDPEGGADTAAALLHQTLGLHKEDPWRFRPQQGSHFHLVDHVRDQEILEDFLGHHSDIEKDGMPPSLVRRLSPRSPRSNFGEVVPVAWIACVDY